MRNLYWLFFVLCLATEIFSQWVQTNGPYGGYFTALATSGNTIFAGTGGCTLGGGIYRSNNYGEDWTEVTNGLTTKWINVIAEYITNAGDTIIFAGTQFGGVFRSTNKGTDWTEVNSGLPDNKWMTSFAFKSDTLFTGLYYGGVYRSSDDGLSWTSAGLGDKNIHNLIVSPDGINIIASVTDGIFRSSDNGKSWNNVSLLHAACLAASGSNIFASSGNIILRSTDNGNTWVPISSLALSVNSIAVLGINLFASCVWSGGVFHSADNGISWHSIGLTDKDIHALTVSSNITSGVNLFAGTGLYGGVFRWTNCDTIWKEVNNGLTHVNISSLAVLTDGVTETNIFAGTSLHGIFHSTDNGTNWFANNSGSEYTSYVSSFAFIDPYLFAGTSSGVYFSTNNGTKWTLSEDIPLHTHISALTVCENNLFAGTYDKGIYRSTDRGTSWIVVNPNLWVTSFAVMGTNIFAGTNDGLFISSNFGISWNKIIVGLQNTWVDPIIVMDSSIVIGTSSGIFMSTNYGVNWNEISGGLNDIYVNDFATDGINLFAGSSEGVFRFNSSDKTWVEVNTGLKHTNVSSLALSPGEMESNHLFVGTDGGVWRRPLSELITEVESVSNLPSDFILEQNYPNPFNPTTKISWQSPVSIRQTLKVYDVLGNEVVTLVDEYKPAGSYEVDFKASNLPSGVYFYQLKAGKYVETKKAILMR